MVYLYIKYIFCKVIGVIIVMEPSLLLVTSGISMRLRNPTSNSKKLDNYQYPDKSHWLYECMSSNKE